MEFYYTQLFGKTALSVCSLMAQATEGSFLCCFFYCIEMFVSHYLVVYHKRFLMNDKNRKGFNVNEPSKYVREFRLTPVFINCPKCSDLHTTITREITVKLLRNSIRSSGFLYYVTLLELLAMTVLHQNTYFYLATNLLLLCMGIIYIFCII